jgi:hypothetical protein
MQTGARIVTRPSGDNLDSAPDLVIGVCFKNQTALKAGHVYEIREFDGVLTLADLGPSWIGVTAKDSIVQSPCWSFDIGDVIAFAGKSIILTKEEFLNRAAKGADDAG